MRGSLKRRFFDQRGGGGWPGWGVRFGEERIDASRDGVAAPEVSGHGVDSIRRRGNLRRQRTEDARVARRSYRDGLSGRDDSAPPSTNHRRTDRRNDTTSQSRAARRRVAQPRYFSFDGRRNS